MARYRLDTIASLANQLPFAPAHVRERQLVAAEELALTLEPAKAYPPAYVVFKLTGFKPKLPTGEMLTGIALQHDLGLLVEEVSAGLNQHVADRSEPVLSIDDVVAGFNVTSKTVQRWRRKGLVARRMIFGDGKKRVGFRLATVERFFAARHDQVRHAANAATIDADELAAMVRNARRLGTACGCCEGEIVRRIARRFGRSPLVIEATLRKHDAGNPTDAALMSAAPPLSSPDLDRLTEHFAAGDRLAIAASKIGRRAPAVYRLRLAERLERLTRKSMRFIDDSLYHTPDAAGQLDELLRGLLKADIAAEPPREMSRVPADLPPYLRELYRTPLLSPPRERALFLKFNFEKFQFVTVRRRLDPAVARVRDVVMLERLLGRLQTTKNSIVQANLRLVVSVAKKHARPGAELMELVSEGNLTLMRAVESFDCHKGNKFSTYATLALMKGYARTVPQLQAAAARGRAGGAIESHACHDDAVDAVDTREHVHCLLGRLDDDERRVLCERFDLSTDGDAPTSASPARDRLIEQGALRKLRALPGVQSA